MKQSWSRKLSRRFIAEFRATDSDGKEYTVQEFRDYTTHRSLAGNEETIEGLSSFKLVDGGHVNWLGKTDFQIVGNGVKIRRN